MHQYQALGRWLLLVAACGCNAKHDQKADSIVANGSNSIGSQPAAAAAPEDKATTSEIEAAHSAELWLSLVDTGKYGDSYDTAASYLLVSPIRTFERSRTQRIQQRIALAPLQNPILH